jgi:hypothetical protein
MKNICSSITTENVEKLANLANSDSIDATCSQVGFCPLPSRRDVQDAQGFKCDLCVFVVGACETWISDNSTISSIESYASSLCNKTESTSQALCIKFVDYTITKLIEVITTSSGPEVVCTAMGICKDSRRDIPTIPQIDKADVEQFFRDN